jgi:hypothetical protein
MFLHNNEAILNINNINLSYNVINYKFKSILFYKLLFLKPKIIFHKTFHNNYLINNKLS